MMWDLDDLVNQATIKEKTGFSKQVVSRWIQAPDFPDPVLVMGYWVLYSWNQVEDWMEQNYLGYVRTSKRKARA